MADYTGPLPVTSPETKPFWDSIRQHRMVLPFCRPCGAFFFYPYDALLPYLTGRRHAAAIDVMVPGYTTAEQFRDTCVRVTAEAQWVVIDRQWSDPVFLQSLFPAMRYPSPPEKSEFEAVLRANFDEIVYESERFELRGRSGRAPAARCDRI